MWRETPLKGTSSFESNSKQSETLTLKQYTENRQRKHHLEPFFNAEKSGASSSDIRSVSSDI